MKQKNILWILVVLVVATIGVITAGNEEQHEVKQEMEINVDLDSNGEFNIERGNKDELQYYDTKEEAIANANPKMYLDYTYAMQIDTPIKSIESDTEAIFFYLSYETETQGCFVIAKFYKKEVDGKNKYGLMYISPSRARKHGIGYENNPEKNVRFSLQTSSVDGMLGFRFEESDERTVWGVTKLEEVNHLLIDGQKPDEVIQYKRFDEDYFFWYYRDLESDADVDDIKIEFEE